LTVARDKGEKNKSRKKTRPTKIGKGEKKIAKQKKKKERPKKKKNKKREREARKPLYLLLLLLLLLSFLFLFSIAGALPCHQQTLTESKGTEREEEKVLFPRPRRPVSWV
jgi:cytoskeletal protein RodZ